MSNLPDPVAVFALVIAFGFAAPAALMTTCYTKLVIVFGLLRTALGLQQTPPTVVLNGIAFILSIYIMAPVAMDVGDVYRAHPPAANATGTEQAMATLGAVQGPMTLFLKKHTHDRERKFFLKTAAGIWPANRVREIGEESLVILVPSFVLGEITRAFQVGFVMYLVFVVVDLIVATVLLALGMSMISPSTVSLPFKLLLFVVLDGWSRLIHALIMSYQ